MSTNSDRAIDRAAIVVAHTHLRIFCSEEDIEVQPRKNRKPITR